MHRTNDEVPERHEEPRRPALSPEERENQLISLAVDNAERQLLNGTASAQVIVHFLKLGSTKEKLEKEKLEKENALLVAKTEALKTAEHIEALYADAMKMFKVYAGEEDDCSDIQ